MIEVSNLHSLLGHKLRINEAILPKELHESIMAGLEKGIQEEADESLRILNERGLKDDNLR